MQELASIVLGLGGRVYVLDIGRSFERQCKFLGGQFIEFSIGSQVCINPFSSIDDHNIENSSDSLSLLKPIISLMVAPKAGTTDYEDSIIERSLVDVWTKFGRKSTIDDLAKILQSDKDQVAQRLGEMLFPYTKRGAYGKFFNGESNINIDDNFIVAELENLKGKSDLQAVVFQIFILIITNKILLGDRKTPSAIEFDEAWQALSGKQASQLFSRILYTTKAEERNYVIKLQGEGYSIGDAIVRAAEDIYGKDD
ncbi:MAG: hypothetical protein EOP34_11590 [Rickettsiales bacterium]|nr:MAG: hypothetical protein EOP34_11590 [Rickettsiales bacterium]